MSKTKVECQRDLDEALAFLDEKTKSRVLFDEVVDHEYFDDEDSRHQVLRRAVEAARELRRAQIRELA